MGRRGENGSNNHCQQKSLKITWSDWAMPQRERHTPIRFDPFLVGTDFENFIPR
jgi:hypothetical protein